MCTLRHYSRFIIVLIIITNSSRQVVVENLYATWIRIDETLPWLELKGEYATRREARQAAEQALNRAMLKIVNIPQEGKPLKALATVRIRR